MTIWLMTIGLQLVLCLLLYFRGHSSRYKILFAFLVYELFWVAFLVPIYLHYGTFSANYALVFKLKNLIGIGFGFGIIWESFRWANACVLVPYQLYQLTLLVKFVTERVQLFSLSHGIYEIFRWGGILLFAWLIFIYRKEAPYERRKL